MRKIYKYEVMEVHRMGTMDTIDRIVGAYGKVLVGGLAIIGAREIYRHISQVQQEKRNEEAAKKAQEYQQSTGVKLPLYGANRGSTK